MSRGISVALLALSVFVLAGCVTPDEPPEAPEAAGGTEPTLDMPAPVGAPDPAAEPPLSKVVAVEGTGTTSQGVWFCTESHGTGGCQGQEVAGGEYTVHLSFEGTLIGAHVNITWDALDPTLETMVIVHGVHTDNGTVRFGPFESTSPTPIDLADERYGDDGLVYIGLWPAAETKTPAGAAFVDVQRQSFSVAGQLVVAQDA